MSFDLDWILFVCFFIKIVHKIPFPAANQEQQKKRYVTKRNS